MKRVIDCGCTLPLCDSDHRALKCKLRIVAKLKRTVSKPKTTRPDLSRFNGNTEEDEQFRIDFVATIAERYTNDTGLYDSVTEKLESAVIKQLSTLPIVKHVRNDWFGDEADTIMPLIRKRDGAFVEANKNANRGNVAAETCLKNSRKDVHNAVIKAKNKWLKHFAKEANLLTAPSGIGTKSGWNAVKALK